MLGGIIGNERIMGFGRLRFSWVVYVDGLCIQTRDAAKEKEELSDLDILRQASDKQSLAGLRDRGMGVVFLCEVVG